MANEIERKFLLRNDTWRKLANESCQISQGYMFFDGGIVRVRITGEKKAFLTLKTPNDGMLRQEFEYPIPLKDARDLLQNVCRKPLIEKKRYKITIRKDTWEIDEFSGQNQGLILAEAELNSTTAKLHIPSWIGREVTNDPIYYNSNLVDKPFIMWNATDRLANLRPKNYSPILNVRLIPENRAAGELKKVYARLLWIAEKNEKGIKDDLDPDFLHDFRVATRKTRALLSRFKKVFPKETTAAYRKDFSLLAQHTNHLRDLDVFILKHHEYINDLPQESLPELTPLFTELAKERQEAYEKTVEFLSSGAYRDFKKRWKTFLTSVDGFSDSTAVISIAKKTIFKSHRKFIRTGNKISSKSPGKKFHALRIKGKKLRYLLEAFSSLFDPEIILTLTTQLKTLQDNLGFANDLSIQIANINRLAENKKGRRKAVNTLLSLLKHKQQILRSEFPGLFANFASETNLRIFKKMLSIKDYSAPSQQ